MRLVSYGMKISIHQYPRYVLYSLCQSVQNKKYPGIAVNNGTSVKQLAQSAMYHVICPFRSKVQYVAAVLNIVTYISCTEEFSYNLRTVLYFRKEAERERRNTEPQNEEQYQNNTKKHANNRTNKKWDHTNHNVLPALAYSRVIKAFMHNILHTCINPLVCDKKTNPKY